MSDRDLLEPEPTCSECGERTDSADGLCADCWEVGAPLVGGDDDDLPPDPQNVCPSCAGCGEGFTAGSTCNRCGGTGNADVADVGHDDREYDDSSRGIVDDD
jgi:predicted amidophosphoribosyltransferase